MKKLNSIVCVIAPALIFLSLSFIVFYAAPMAAAAYSYDYGYDYYDEPELSPLPESSPPPPSTPTPENIYNYTNQLEIIIELLHQIIYQNIEENEAEQDLYFEYEYEPLYELTKELIDQVRIHTLVTLITSSLIIGAIIAMAVLSKWNMGV